MSTNNQVIQSMFNHLVQSYSADEAREILIQKYPDAENDIQLMDATVEDQAEQSTLAAAVKQKTSKKVAKPAKVKTESKMDRARQLYNSATDKSRKAMLEVFNKELGLSKAAASTYFYTVKN